MNIKKSLTKKQNFYFIFIIYQEWKREILINNNLNKIKIKTILDLN
jgi:hypothetical protein